MISRLPVIGPGLSLSEILFASLFREHRAGEELRKELAAMTAAKGVLFTDSGISAFSVLLEALKTLSDRDEVVLPAYTAGSLVVAVRKSGLRPVLCDVSLDDFNLDTRLLGGCVSSRTLAVVCVHMFGIGMRGLGSLGRGLGGAFVVEDCAQSMGSEAGGSVTGSQADASFFSFNRGKNFPLASGGCVCCRREDIFAAVKGQERLLGWGAGNPLAPLALYFAVKPFIYGAAQPLIGRFRETRPPSDFACRRMADFHMHCGSLLARRMRRLFQARYDNGNALRAGLRGVDGLRLPLTGEGDRPVFNRFPVMFEDPARSRSCRKRLWEAGIESSPMYLKPLHHMLDLGYAPEEFPNARVLAEGLLTLPCHPGCSPRHIATMIEVVRSCR